MVDMETLKRTNPEQYNAYQMIANTRHSFFLTGTPIYRRASDLYRECVFLCLSNIAYEK